MASFSSSSSSSCSSSSSHRRSSFFKQPVSSARLRAATSLSGRRRRFLQRQREARAVAVDSLRALALSALQEEQQEEQDGLQGQEQRQFGQEGGRGRRRGRGRGRRRRRAGRQGDGAAGGMRQFWAAQLCTPEWMVEVPQGLLCSGEEEGGGSAWTVMARPEGRRCLVVAARGRTVARLQSGVLLHEWRSSLPNGGAPGTGSGRKRAEECTILDCVFDETNRTFRVLDLMCWKDYSLYDCTADFRYFWGCSQLEPILQQQKQMEDAQAAAAITKTTATTAASAAKAMPEAAASASQQDKQEEEEGQLPFRFAIVPRYQCTLQGLRSAYEEPLPFERDGLLFYHKQAHYTRGLTPLVLCWKDEAIAQYLMSSERQEASLILGPAPDFPLRTFDDVPLACLSPETVEAHNLGQGTLVRVSFDTIVESTTPASASVSLEQEHRPRTAQAAARAEQEEDQQEVEAEEEIAATDIECVIPQPQASLTAGPPQPALHNVSFERAGSRNKGVADPWTKVLFQYMARTTPLTIQDIVHLGQQPQQRHLEAEQDGQPENGDTIGVFDMSEMDAVLDGINDIRKNALDPPARRQRHRQRADRDGGLHPVRADVEEAVAPLEADANSADDGDNEAVGDGSQPVRR